MKHLLFITLIFNTLGHFAFSNIKVSAANNELDLTDNIEFFIEGDTPLTHNQAILEFKNGGFKNSKEKRCLNFGTHSKPVWLHVSLYSEDDVEKILHYACSYIYYLDVYENDGDEWKVLSKTGKKRSFKKRGNLAPTDFAWDIHFTKNKKKELLLRVETRSVLLVPLTLKSIDHYSNLRSTEFYLYGLYFGILAIMLLYNLIIYFSLKEKTYLYYILSIFCTIMIFSSSNGFSAKYYFPFSWQINYFLSEIFMCLILGPTTMFAITFLELKKYSKFAYYLMKSLALISIPSMFFVIVFEHSKLANSLVAILAVSLLTVGIISLIKKNPFAKYYVLAWATYLLGGFCVTLRNLGYFPSNFITDNGAEIGSAFEVCLLAFALADKYKKIRFEKKQLQIKHLKLIETQKNDLEKLVQERTTKLVETVEELNATLAHLNEQQIELEQKNQNITSSINYALKIQEATLPDVKHLKESFEDYTQLYLPKDIVSGDFIFFLEEDNLMYYAVADCTGHGVPGAILGMLGYNLLYEIIKVHHITSPDKILTELDQKLTSRLKQNTSGIHDGMDISLLMIDKKSNTVQYSGAMNPLLIIYNDNSTTTIKGSRRSISDYHRKDIQFDLHTLNSNKIKWIYMYSDGFQDQFGEQSKTKYFSKRLKQFIIDNANETGNKQSALLLNEFNNWKGTETQMDDVTVTGIKLN